MNVLGAQRGVWRSRLLCPAPSEDVSPALCKIWIRESWLTKRTLYDVELGANSHLQVDFFPPFWTLWLLSELPALIVTLRHVAVQCCAGQGAESRF